MTSIVAIGVTGQSQQYCQSSRFVFCQYLVGRRGRTLSISVLAFQGRLMGPGLVATSGRLASVTMQQQLLHKSCTVVRVLGLGSGRDRFNSLPFCESLFGGSGPVTHFQPNLHHRVVRMKWKTGESCKLVWVRQDTDKVNQLWIRLKMGTRQNVGRWERSQKSREGIGYKGCQEEGKKNGEGRDTGGNEMPPQILVGPPRCIDNNIRTDRIHYSISSLWPYVACIIYLQSLFKPLPSIKILNLFQKHKIFAHL